MSIDRFTGSTVARQFRYEAPVTRVALLAALAFTGCVTTSGTKLTPREQALVFLQKGDGKSALPLLTDLARKSPNDLDLARLVAEAHVKSDDTQDFLKSLEKQDTAIAHYQQGLVRFSRTAEASDAALAHFRRAIELDPSQPEYRYRLGIGLLESEQFAAARVELQAAVDAAPQRSGWYLPLAKARFRTGDTKGAVDGVRTAILGNPTPNEVKLARALMEQIADPFSHFPRSARPQLEQAIQWLEVADMPQQAIVELEELLHDFPDEAILHALLGLSYGRIDDAGRAIDELKRAVELAPEDGKNHLYLAQLYEGHQRAQTAEEHYRKALEKNPVLDEAWLKMGDLSFERQDYVSARQQYAVAAHLVPDSEAARGKLALMYQLDGNWPAAVKEIQAILDRDPENMEFTLRLGLIHMEHFLKARTAEERETAATQARKYLSKVLEAQPENALASRAVERLNLK